MGIHSGEETLSLSSLPRKQILSFMSRPHFGKTSVCLVLFSHKISNESTDVCFHIVSKASVLLFSVKFVHFCSDSASYTGPGLFSDKLS